jgi:hypothetical protein
MSYNVYFANSRRLVGLERVTLPCPAPVFLSSLTRKMRAPVFRPPAPRPSLYNCGKIIYRENQRIISFLGKTHEPIPQRSPG